MLFAIVCVLFALGFIASERIEAGVYDNAYTFYNKKGSDMIFTASKNEDGEIYFAIVGKESTATIKYKTIGWKVTVEDEDGEAIDIFYYDLKGDDVELVDETSKDGNNYQLYMVTLSNLKSKMSKDAKSALKKANCNIIFDSCTTVVINGKEQGKMTSKGPSENVYTTYKTLVAAQEWSDASKKLLKTFYDKEVVNLFCEVVLKGVGEFDNITGYGKYCYGTTVTIKAVPEKKYNFEGWIDEDKKTVSTDATYKFKIQSEEVTFTAVANLGMLKLNYFTGFETDGNPSKIKYYSYEKTTQAFWNPNWIMNGYHTIGWRCKKDGMTHGYGIGQVIGNQELEELATEADMYAIWEANTYRIVYHENGGTGWIPSKGVAYTEKITLPQNGYTKANHSFSGWSVVSDDLGAMYIPGQEMSVAELVNACQMQNVNDVEIHLYAIWNESPVIIGDSIYITLSQAQSGQITENWFSNYVHATDREDGKIAYGQHKNNSLCMINFQAQDYKSFQKEGYIMERFQSIDSAGNTTLKNIKVYIVDVQSMSASLLQGDFRFISQEYYKSENGAYIDYEQGGLLPNSIWRCDETYRKILDALYNLK